MQCSISFAVQVFKNSSMSSLIPEPSLVISPNLAATIGLEEATLLSYLSAVKEHLPSEHKRGFSWYQLQADVIAKQLPFWRPTDIQRVSESLRDKGVLLVGSAPLSESGQLIFAFNEACATAPEPEQKSVGQPTSDSKRANRISPAWQPDETVLQLLAQRGVPGSFATDQVAEFVHYWHERGEARHAWGNRFINHVLREWRQFEQTQNQHKHMDLDQDADRQPDLISGSWTPSSDAMEILENHAEIPRSFILEAVPEFILYWRETGDKSNTWNARFINHIRRQWSRFQHTIENDVDPKPISADWRPNPDVYDILALARIDTQFARDRVKEFIVYWQDRNEVRPSWNSTFIHYVKQQWLQAHSSGSHSTRDTSLSHELSDRSWAG